MVDISGRRVAVAGMGVSGLAMGRAVLALGGLPVVFDQKPNDAPSVISAVDSLDAAGVPAVTGWHGRLDPAEFDILLLSPGFPKGHPAIRDMVNARRPVWSEIEFAYLASKVPILAVTGTNGKSTTTVLLWLLIQAAGHNAVLCGNIAGSGYPEMTLTEAAMKTSDGFLTAEVSSYHLEWVETFAPRVAAITNISPDHMDRYKFFDEYYNTKLRIFESMSTSCGVVVNADEPSLPIERVEACLTGRAPIIAFSPSGLKTGTGHAVRTGANLDLSGFKIAIDELAITGEHSVTNIMMAWEMATQVVEAREEMIDALRSFSGLANRMEVVGKKNGITVINNSMCTNPAAVVASSKGLDKPQLLLMGGSTKNLDFSPVGEYLRSSHHKVYVFGQEHVHMCQMLGVPPIGYSTLEEAFADAISEAKPGEAVMLSPGCASAYPYSNFKERGDAFKDMVAQWLQQ
ncbi:MAG: UDP-N-acetylmuramoyl-L-alanine--D-glutamate ligase [Chthonomonadaceae bacterium]|nr:UDP-N-acetylmuramoyl-L-alanine--D-glutamate ligase [Chthonomonadaceae bacterium]